MYLSPVPFEKLGFPTLRSEPVTINTERAMGAVPPVLLGVAAAMSGFYWLFKRREKMSQAEAGDEEKQGEKVK